MNKKSNAEKRNLSMSVILAGTLIMGAGLYYREVLSSDRVKMHLAAGKSLFLLPDTIIFIAIVLLGVGAIVFAYWKKVKLYRRIGSLDESYRSAFEAFEEFVALSGLSKSERSDLNNEVLALFMEAHNNGRTVRQVVGDNQEAFAHEMIDAYGIKNFWVHDILTGIQFFVFYMFAGTFLLSVKQEAGVFQAEMPYSLITFFVLSAFVIIPLVYRNKRKVFDEKEGNLPKGALALTIISVAFMAGFIISMEGIEALSDQNTFAAIFVEGSVKAVASAWHLAGLLLVFAFSTGLKKRLRRFKK